MSYHFSANQYENAFKPKKLKNWTVPREYKERPSALEGFTQIIATDRGHLKANVPRSSESPWGTFMGTWDMPLKIPPARPSYTARSQRAAEDLKTLKESTPLNEAVNGYKEFKCSAKKKVKKNSLTERPKTPSPPAIEEKAPKASPVAMEPSAGVKSSPKSVTPRKSASPKLVSNPTSPASFKAVSPRNSRPGSNCDSPVRMIDVDHPASPVPSPAPSVKSAILPRTPGSGRPASRENARNPSPQRSLTLAC